MQKMHFRIIKYHPEILGDGIVEFPITHIPDTYVLKKFSQMKGEHNLLKGN